jgi:hypothetical protein
MPEEGKLINFNVDFSGLKGLSDGAKVFLERISAEIGAFTKPHHKRRMAQAKADAAIIAAEGKIRLTELQERGLLRVVLEEGRRQENIESIAQKTIPHIKDDAKAEGIEADWLSNFFDKAKFTTNDQLQEIWARLLAEETNRPRTVSKRTIFLLSQLDRHDAELFSRLAPSVWTIGNTEPLLFWKRDLYSIHLTGLTFIQLKHLDSLGLINFDPVSGFNMNFGPSREVGATYHDKHIILQLPEGRDEIFIGNVLFSQSGREIFRAIEAVFVEQRFHDVLGEFAAQNLQPFCPTMFS